MPNKNGYNDESTVVVGTALDFSGIYEGLEKLEKTTTKASKDGKIDLEVSKKSSKDIQKLQQQIHDLDDYIKSVEKKGISRSTVYKFKADLEKRVSVVEKQVESLQKVLGDTLGLLDTMSDGVSFTKLIDEFKKTTTAALQTVDAISEISKITEGTNSTITIDTSGVDDLKKALEGLEKQYSNYQKAKNESFDDIPIQKLITRYNMLSKSFSAAFKEYQKYATIRKGTYDDLDSTGSDKLISDVNFRAAGLKAANIANQLTLIKDTIERIQSNSDDKLIDFDEGGIAKFANNVENISKQFVKTDEEALSLANTINEIIKENLELNKQGENGVEKSLEQANEEAKVLTDNLENINILQKEVGKQSLKAQKKIEQAKEEIQKQLTLKDILDSNVINIEVKTDYEEVKQKLDAQIRDLQENLNNKPLIVPIRVSLRANTTGKETVEQISEVREKELADARKLLNEENPILMDLEKVTVKSSKSVLKVIENAINKFVLDVKEALNSIFSETRNVHFELDPEDLANAKKMLQADSLINKDDISQNLEHANEVAKKLVENIKEVLGLMEDANTSSFGLTNYKVKGKKNEDKEFDAKSLIGQIKKYKEQAEEVRNLVQKDIFDKKPVYLSLDVKDKELTKIREKVDNAEIGKPLTQSLTKAESIAESVVEILSKLNGLDIKITNGKAKTETNDITFVLKGLTDILKALKEINTTIANVKLTPVDSQLQNVKTDFTEITKKFDELMSKSDELVKKLIISLKSIQTSVENLGTAIDKALDEKTLHSVVDELNGIDLSRLETTLSTISIQLINVSSVIDRIASTIKQMDDNSLETQWKNIAIKFREIANYTDDIDLRKSKKQAEEIVSLYSQYKKSGGTNAFSMLTSNVETLEKLQKIANKTQGTSFTIVDNERLKETRVQLQELDTLLSSITTSLTSINGLQNVSKVFNSLAINDNVLNRINNLPNNLKLIAEKLREIDNTPYDGFIKQIEAITKESESLKSLAYVLKHSEKQIKTAMDIANGGVEYKAAQKELNGIAKTLRTTYKNASKRKLSKNNDLFTIEQVSLLEQISEKLKVIDSYKDIKLVTEDSVRQYRTLINEVEILFDKLSQVEQKSKEFDVQLKQQIKDQQKQLKVQTDMAKRWEREYYSRWGYGKIPTEYGSEYGLILTQIRNKVDELKRLGDIDVVTETEIKQAENLNVEIKQLFEELVKVNKTAKETQITNLQNKIGSYIEKNTRLTTSMHNQLVTLFERLNAGADLTDVELKEIAADFNRIQYSAKVAGKEGAGFLDAIRNKLKYGWAQSIAMFFSFYDIIRYAREISGAVTEINTNLIELAKVSDASIGQLYADFNDFNQIAKETGGTVNDIIQATADWSRNGYNLPDSKNLARISSIFQNIGDGMTAAQSNEYLVSILKGFDIEAKDAMVVLDTLNNVSNNAASSVQDLGEALERSSSAFGASNTNLSESVALLTKANEILQNPENVGTAFKSMSARLRAADTEIESLEDGFTMTTSKLRNLVQALTGFDIQETEDSYKSIYQILLGIGKEWNNLTDLQQASLSEELFGKRNSQVGFAILNDVERLEEIYDLAITSEGSALEEHQKYLEGVQYQIDVFSASVENLANTFMSSDFLKGAIQTGTTFVNVLEKIIDKLGAIPALVGAVGTAIGAKWNLLYNFASFSSFKPDEKTLPLTANTDINALAGAGNARAINTLIKEYKALGTEASKTMMSVDQFNAKLAEGNTLFGQYVLSLKDGAVPNLKDYRNYVIKTTAKTTALRIATGLLQGALFAIAGIILTKVVKALDDWIHRTERAIELGEEAKQRIDEINSSLETQEKTIKDYGKRFAELSQGIDQLTGKNISLSDEDYQEFLDISNKLAEVFPSLTKHYDENGNAIVDLDGNVNTIVGSLNNLLEVEKQLAQQKILEDVDDVFEGVKGNVKQLTKEAIKLEDEVDIEKITEALNSIGANGYAVNYIGTGRSSYVDSIQFSNIKFLTRENLNKLTEEYGKELPNFVRQLNDLYNESLSKYATLSPYIATQLFSDYNFAKLSPTLQAGIQDIINNLDWNSLSLEDNSWTGLIEWIDDNLLSLLNNNPELAEGFELVLNTETKFNNSEVSWKEYQADLQAFVNLLKALNVDDDIIKDFTVSLGLNIDSNGNIINTYVNNLKNQLEDSGIDEEVSKYITDNLTKGELEALYNSDANWRELLDVDGYEKAVDEMKKYQERGNVDLFNRKKVSGKKMIEAGWTQEEYGMEPDSIATVFSSMYDILDKNGNKAIIHVTPILPDGTILSPEELENYVYENLQGANDILKADDKGIVLAVDENVVTDSLGNVTEQAWKVADEWDVQLHELQEKILLNGQLTAEEILEIIVSYASKISQIPFKINFDRKSISSVTEGIGQIQSVYQSIYEAAQEGKVGEELAVQFSTIEALGEKLGNVSEYKDIWNDFYDVVTDGSHSFEEMEDALNRVLTAYVNASIDIENFDKAEADAISTQLQLAGVTKESADTYVEAMSEIAEATELASDEGYDLLSITGDVIDGLVSEGQISEETGQKLALFALQKKIANGLVIKTDADIKNIQQLMAWANLTSDSLQRLIKLKSLMADVEAGKTIISKSRLENIKKAAEELETISQEDINNKLSEYSSLSLDQSKAANSSKSGGGKESDPWKEAYEKELKELDHLHEMGLISDIHYYEEREKLNDKYFKDREKYTDEYNKNLEEIYKGFVSAYKQYVDDMSDYWEKSLEAGQISFQQYCQNMTKMLEDLHNAGKIDDETYYSKMADYYGSVISNYDKAINAAQRLLKKQIDSLNKQKDSIEKSYKEQIELVQQEIDKLKEANDERQKELDLQKALYELNRAQNQRTQYTYTSEQGYVYKAKDKDIKNAQEEVEQTQYEMYISTLEKKIESLETEMENLTSAIDEQIDKLQDYSDRLGETANKWKEAHEDMVAASIWGADWQNSILSMSESLLADFTNNYVAMQQRQADMAVAAANVIVDSYNKQIEALNKWKEAQASAGTTSGTSKLGSSNISTKTTTQDTTKKTTTTKRNVADSVNRKMGWGTHQTRSVYVYGKGTDKAAPGYHEIAEDGDEIVLDNYGNAFYAEGHQLHKFEGGEIVFNEKETKELLKGKYLPIEEVLPNYADMLDKVVKSGVMQTSLPSNTSISKNLSAMSKPDISNSINITIGDIHVTEVEDATELAKAITNKLPNALIQELNRKS